jgi:hypothetical protein
MLEMQNKYVLYPIQHFPIEISDCILLNVALINYLA